MKGSTSDSSLADGTVERVVADVAVIIAGRGGYDARSFGRVYRPRGRG
ncbi:hypothetical protein [Dietzia natronolimnaea]|nr:hypothetical protein [Dietzia natronolimnaea]